VAVVVSEETDASTLTDPEQFRVFYAATLPRVYGYFYHRLGGDVAAAEDLTQETFLAAVAELRRGKPVAVPLPWLFGIARHKLLDHLRRQRRAGWTLLSWDDAGDDELIAPEDDEAARERAILALAIIPSPQREALVLRYLDGFSVPEVATALGRSVSAAESLLARGRVAFRRAFQEVGDDR
jgi:RNA polymerase sigma-70 factor (ECF subfamily)